LIHPSTPCYVAALDAAAALVNTGDSRRFGAKVTIDLPAVLKSKAATSLRSPKGLFLFRSETVARIHSFALAALAVMASFWPAAAGERWPAEKARQWGEKQPWLVGSNYIPSTAINQLEMWQADSFDPETIDRELGWAEELGFNSMRVFLHHLLWEQDRDGFLARMEQFLDLAEKHKIGVMFVPFDSVWDPNPKLGKQREPQPGLHNSGWVQSPGAADLMNADRHGLLKEYVLGVIGHFKDDPRVQVWDLWNEPDNLNGNSYGKDKLKQEPEGKLEATVKLLPQVFDWAREAGPTQPLTSGVWIGNWGNPEKLSATERVLLEMSDVISFHSYGSPDEVKKCVENLKRYVRPILCTEYMARPRGSTFDPILKQFRDEKVAAYNWGFVAGKSNTIYPWDSWQKPYASEPEVWFHDIFRADGAVYIPREAEYIKGVTKGVKSAAGRVP
jgi:hypothetical protein